MGIYSEEYEAVLREVVDKVIDRYKLQGVSLGHFGYGSISCLNVGWPGINLRKAVPEISKRAKWKY